MAITVPDGAATRVASLPVPHVCRGGPGLPPGCSRPVPGQCPAWSRRTPGACPAPDWRWSGAGCSRSCRARRPGSAALPWSIGSPCPGPCSGHARGMGGSSTAGDARRPRCGARLPLPGGSSARPRRMGGGARLMSGRPLALVREGGRSSCSGALVSASAGRGHAVTGCAVPVPWSAAASGSLARSTLSLPGWVRRPARANVVVVGCLDAGADVPRVCVMGGAWSRDRVRQKWVREIRGELRSKMCTNPANEKSPDHPYRE